MSELVGGSAGCLARQYEQQVDTALNGGAIDEATDAHSGLQAPEDGIRDDSASSYLDDAEVSFRPEEGTCERCASRVKLSADGSVEKKDCDATGQCDALMATRYPEQFTDAAGRPVVSSVLCRGFGCAALVEFGYGKGGPLVVSAPECAIERAGENWWTKLSEADTAELEYGSKDGFGVTAQEYK